MQTKSKLMLAVLAALAIGASSAFGVTEQVARGGDDFAPPPTCPDSFVEGYCGGLLAKNGADDVLPEGPDNGGVDFIIMLAKDGADDLPGDDHGVDPIAKDGADDLPGDDHGVDLIAKDGADDLPGDDHGVDPITG